MIYKISELSNLTGIPISTLRYYEEIGLLKPERNSSNYRVYGEKDLRWIEFIARAKATGMTLSAIKTYSDLREKGESTIIERIGLLIDQERILLAQKAEIQSHLDFIQHKKLAYYQALEEKNGQI